jgi:hypothetical protein
VVNRWRVAAARPVADGSRRAERDTDAAGPFHFAVSVDDPTTKDYTLVIAALPAATSTTEPIANTGAHVRPIANLGVWSGALGALMPLAASWTARRARRYRRAH